VGTIVAERAFDVVSLALLFVAAVVFQFEVVTEYGLNLFQQLFSEKSGEFSVTKSLIIISVLVVVIVMVKVWFRMFAHLKLVIFIKRYLKGIWHGLVSAKDLERKVPFILCSLGIWAMYLWEHGLAFHATIGTAGLGFEIAISSLAFASIGMIVTPGGIGAYAYFMAKVLEKNNVPFELGFANGTLQWFAQFIIVLFIGFISLGLLPYTNKKKNTRCETPTSYPLKFIRVPLF
jgi:hypothetical protein